MAWPNIDQRRKEVAALLSQRGGLSSAERKALAGRFGCSSAAIAADVIALTVVAPATLHVTPTMRRRIATRDGGECQYCGRTDARLIAEHVIPASMGGVALPFNLVAACQSCNTRKRGRTWIPRNLNAITAEHPEWRERVLIEVARNKPAPTRQETTRRN